MTTDINVVRDMLRTLIDDIQSHHDSRYEILSIKDKIETPFICEGCYRCKDLLPKARELL